MIVVSQVRTRDRSIGGQSARRVSPSSFLFDRSDLFPSFLFFQVAQGLAKKALDNAKRGIVSDLVIADIKVGLNPPLFFLSLSSHSPQNSRLTPLLLCTTTSDPLLNSYLISRKSQEGQRPHLPRSRPSSRRTRFGPGSFDGQACASQRGGG